MTLVDVFLRADTPAALAAACPYLVDDEGGWVLSGDSFAFDPIGPVVLVPGIYDDEGNEVTPPIVDDRFHANLRCTPEIAAQVPEHIKVLPDTPVRAWL